jgi:MFS transporter, FSR family, fosmidomycin resistance protein
MKWKKMTFLAFGHFASDFYSGLLPPLLPIFIASYGWNLTQTGLLVMVTSIFMNALQPLIGILNDRYPLRSFLWLGPMLSALPFCAVFLVHGFDVMLVILSISGIGVAMYHPVGAVAAGHDVDEHRRVVSMAFFSSGGSVGITAAPLVMVLVNNILGPAWMPVVALPAVIMLISYTRNGGIVVSEHEGHTLREMFASMRGHVGQLVLLWSISGFRAMAYAIVGNFLALLMIARGYSYSESAYFLSAAILAGLAGMFIGGHIADRYGKRRTIALSLILSCPLFYGFSFTTGPVSVLFLLLGMVSLTSTIPVNIVLAQKAVPRLPGMASSLVMGLSFMFGALAAPPFGALADRIGIEAAMRVIFIFPVIGAVLVQFLRKE